MKTMSKEAKIIIKRLLDVMPRAHCESFHHSKKDRHEFGQPCPCVERYNQTIKMAEEFINSKNKHLTHTNK